MLLRSKHGKTLNNKFMLIIGNNRGFFDKKIGWQRDGNTIMIQFVDIIAIEGGKNFKQIITKIGTKIFQI